MTSPRWAAAIDDAIRAGTPPTSGGLSRMVAAERVRLGERGALDAADRLASELLGLGPVEPLAEDPDVTDILVNGDGSVWLDTGTGLDRADVDVGDVRALAGRLAGLARRRLDDAQPWVDGVLPSGIRLHAVLPPVAHGGAHISLRIPRRRPGGVDGLVTLGSVDPETADVLRRLVAARVAFVVTGGTGVGKTTVLGALLAECPARERLVIVEDVRELDPAHPHVVHLQGRMPNVEGAGAVTMTDLVRQALRMRPDRLVVGEVRGAEVRELLAALNTGHEGGCGTLHANGVDEVPARFEALGALAGMTPGAVHAQLRGAVRVVVHLRRRGPLRHVAVIGVLAPTAAGEVAVTPALHCRPRAVNGGPVASVHGPAWARLAHLLDGEDP